MNKPLLDGPISVSETIEKFEGNHMGRSPTLSEFRDMCVASGNTNAEIDGYVEDAIGAGVVRHDKNTDTLVISDWRKAP